MQMNSPGIWCFQIVYINTIKIIDSCYAFRNILYGNIYIEWQIYKDIQLELFDFFQ